MCMSEDFRGPSKGTVVQVKSRLAFVRDTGENVSGSYHGLKKEGARGIFDQGGRLTKTSAVV